MEEATVGPLDAKAPTVTPAAAPQSSFQTPVAWLLGALLLAVVALRFAQPIEDGDLFWHMAYGSQMVERGTLKLDHSLYSWMPAANDTVYCAWTGELLFLGVWKTFASRGIFALRYVAIVAVLALACLYARRCGLLARPESWLVTIVALLASVVATFPKPELLSLVLWHAVLFCWFGMLLAIESGRDARPWIYAIPALMVIWVNTHGGFILAAPFLLVAGISGPFLLTRRDAGHLGIAVGLSALAALANPYGIRYPLQLIDFVSGRTARPDVAWNNAFQPTFGAGGAFHHLPEFLAWMMLGMAAVVFRSRRRPRWMVAALFLAYLPLYVLYVRSTFLLPAIFAYGVLYLARGRVGGKWPAALACALFLFFGARTVYQARFRPDPDTWMGFGISYFEPVDEAEFLRAGKFGPRIYNTFNAGGYLLWKLYPRYRVMVDARSFPYLGWFEELYQFMRTEKPEDFQAFLDRHPADVALLDFQEDLVWRSFLRMRGWRPVFFGPAAAVFAPVGAAAGPLQRAESLSRLRNGAAGLKAFAFARAIGDYQTAWNLLDQMEGPLRRETDPQSLAAAHAYRAGHEALRAGDYGRAYSRFEDSFRHDIIDDRDNLILFLLRALNKVDAGSPQAITLRAGLSRLMAGI
ncbi:MAG: hypothetical protein M3Z85_13590 [Acidobacteriota bacterium]|nr:hypothetical protein [Acidobacteriota bacterium]